MKTYNMLGIDIGIEIQAESTEEAMEKAREMFLQGLGGDFIFLNDEDRQEYEEGF